MIVEEKDIPVNTKTMTAEIDATNGSVIYIVENGQVKAVPLPAFGALEIPCQNYRIGNIAYRITLKRK